MGKTFMWTSSGRTHEGNVRKHNEDSLLTRDDVGIWVVADGMGGHSAGDVASQMTVRALEQVNPPAGGPAQLAQMVEKMESALISVNQELVNVSAKTQSMSGSTVVALHMSGKHAVLMWAGDSRIYRLRGSEFRQLSTDHSQIEQFIEQGLITRAEADTHPAANMITRAVGANPELYLEMDIHELQNGDKYLLCSDGLDKHVNDPEIAAVISQHPPAHATQKLIDMTLARGAIDNVSVVLIEVSTTH